MILRIFNPSHDECLASGSPYYTPSRTARLMDEVHLPGWYCLGDDLPAWESVDKIEPWGWDARLKRELQKRGCPPSLLPSDTQLADIRRLSSRQTAVRLLPLLTTHFHNAWACNMEEVEAAQNQLAQVCPSAREQGGMLFKSPWSCSGRGVFAYDVRRIRKVIREQGGIEVEPLYRRVADFAMEFRCEDGKVEFLGLSAMLNAPLGERNHADYGGNLVLSDADILSLMTRYVPQHEVLDARDRLIDVLEQEIAPFYNGPLGVDQMIVGPDYALHPLVEINLRHTMGHVALACRAF